jgi:hypothetical protein
MKSVSSAARKPPVELETPFGGIEMIVICPPFAKLGFFPTIVKVTTFVDAL